MPLYFTREMYSAEIFYIGVIKSPSTSKKIMKKNHNGDSPGIAVFVWDHTTLQPCLTEPEISILDVT